MISAVATGYNAPAFGCAGPRPVSFAAAAEASDMFARTEPAPSSLNPLQRLGEKMIHWYQNDTFFHKWLYPKINLRCAYAERGLDSCSQDTLNAIRNHGFFKGCVLGLLKILSCNPITQRSERFRDVFAHIGTPRGQK